MDVWQPVANCVEKEEAYFIEVELPGVSLDETDVELSGNKLVVSGLREAGSDNIGLVGAFSKNERTTGRFERSFELPSDSETDDVAASMENGLLIIKIAKQQRNRTRVKVAIKPGS